MRRNSWLLTAKCLIEVLLVWTAHRKYSFWPIPRLNMDLRKIFKIPSAQRGTLNINRRSQHYGNILSLAFLSDRFPQLLKKSAVKGAGGGARRRKTDRPLTAVQAQMSVLSSCFSIHEDHRNTITSGSPQALHRFQMPVILS